MKMIDKLSETMIAPCGVNCIACSAYLSDKKPCAGCRASNELITRKSCRNCTKKKCAFDKGLQWCFQCSKFPCSQIKDLNKRYTQNYNVDLMQNGLNAKKDMGAFLETQIERFTCKICGGIVDQHHKKCSNCGLLINRVYP